MAKTIMAVLLIIFLSWTLNAKTIYLTDPESAFTPSVFYFPGAKLPEQGSLNLFLLYELGKSKVYDKKDDSKIFESDLQNQKIVLSYSLLDNFQLYIGKNIANYAYDLNENHMYITGYNLFLEKELNTYLTTSQYNLLFPFGFNPVMHPDRDRRDNIFGFVFKMFNFQKYRVSAYLDFYKEDRCYYGIFYPLKIGFPPVPETFVDFIMGIDDNYTRIYVSYDYKYFTLYTGFENLRRRTSMYNGSYDDFHDYQTYIAKLNAKYNRLEASFGLKKDAVGLNIRYQTPEYFGIEFNYRKIKQDLEDSSNYFSNIFNQNINFREEEEIIGFSITQKF